MPNVVKKVTKSTGMAKSPLLELKSKHQIQWDVTKFIAMV